MRLLIVSTIASTLEAFLLPFAEYFRALGWQVDAMANGAITSDACRRAFDHVWDNTWSRQPLDLRNLIYPVRQVRHSVLQRNYDVVHVHTPVAAFVTRYALRGLRSRGASPGVVYTAHGFHFYEDARGFHNREFLWLEQLAGCWTDYLITINREDETLARKCRIVPSDRVIYMPGIGVDTGRYCPAASHEAAINQLRRELELAEGDLLFLMIAEFNPAKRHRDAIQALAALDHPRVHLAFAGTGPYLASARDKAKALRIDKRVHFLGFRTDIPVLIGASVATLLPSEREGLPRSVMESLSLGVPVIGTNIRGIRDLVGNSAGMLVDVARPDELARAMLWVVEHPDEARAMGERGRKHMAGYDIRNILELHRDLYQKVLPKAQGVKT